MYYTGTPLSESIAAKLPSTAIHLEDFSYNPGYSSEGLLLYIQHYPLAFTDNFKLFI